MEAELVALATAGATALVQQMATDGWAGARERMTRFLARRGAASPESIESDLETAQGELTAARREDDEETAEGLQAEWRNRLRRALRADPAAAGELSALLAELGDGTDDPVGQAPGPRIGTAFGGEVRARSAVQAGEIGSLTQHLHFHGSPDAYGPDGLAEPVGAAGRGGPASGGATAGRAELAGRTGLAGAVAVLEHQLPLEEEPFENRDTEREAVLRTLEERQRSSPPARPLTVVFSGVSGIGKTALAVRLAHELKPRFRTRYVDLDEWRTAGSLDLAAVLKHLLSRLGVAESWIPAEYRRLVRLYEERTQGARLALVLDNAWSADEITTLLPVSAESVVLIAARERLPALEARGALGLALGPLSHEHGMELLRRITAPVRPDEPDRSLTRLARVCDGFPVALRAAGTLLYERPGRRAERLAADLAAQLEQRGLPVVEAVWNATYGGLAAPAARLYRLLPDHPGYDITPEAAAALIGTDVDEAADALDDLTAAGLLSPSPSPPRGPGRSVLRGLLRAHAARCAAGHGDPAESREGLLRLLVWYRRQAERADRAIAEGRLRRAEPVPEQPYGADVPFDSYVPFESRTSGPTAEASGAAARRWLDTERKALYGFVRIAVELGEDDHAWALCEALWKHYEDQHNHDDAIRAFELGRDAALRCERPDALIRMRCQLAQALWKTGRAHEADQETEHAVRSAESVEAGTVLHASALEFRGKFLAWRGEPDRAVEYFERSRAIHRARGNAYGVLLLGFLLGRSLRAAGRPAEAEPEMVATCRLAREQRHDRMAARATAELGRVHRAAGDVDRAVTVLGEALVLEARRGSTYDEAALHEELADLAEERDDRATAREHRTRARELRQSAGVAAAPDA